MGLLFKAIKWLEFGFRIIQGLVGGIVGFLGPKTDDNNTNHDGRKVPTNYHSA